MQHEDPRKIAGLRRAFRQGKMCNYIMPVPKALTETVSGFLGDADEQAKLEAQTKANVEKYGYGNWYDFCVNEWGTKWDVGERGGDNRLDANTVTFNFDSAWSPPMDVYEKMIAQGYDVVAYYYEPGMAYVGKYENGVDDCYEYSGENSKTVRAAIGDELDDMFAISETMAEYDDEEEELTEWIRDGEEQRKKLGLIEG